MYGRTSRVGSAVRIARAWTRRRDESLEGEKQRKVAMDVGTSVKQEMHQWQAVLTRYDMQVRAPVSTLLLSQETELLSFRTYKRERERERE